MSNWIEQSCKSEWIDCIIKIAENDIFGWSIFVLVCVVVMAACDEQDYR